MYSSHIGAAIAHERIDSRVREAERANAAARLRAPRRVDGQRGPEHGRRRLAVAAAAAAALTALLAGAAEARQASDSPDRAAATALPDPGRSTLLAHSGVPATVMPLRGYLNGDRAATAQAMSNVPAVRAELRQRLEDQGHR